MAQNRNGAELPNPEKTITRMIASDYNHPEILFGEVAEFNSGSSIIINFLTPDTIFSGEKDSIALKVTIAETPEQSDFRISLNSEANIFIKETSTNNIPVIVAEDGDQGGAIFDSDFLVILSNNLKESFINYPNPFGSVDKPTTKITYYLKQDTDVEIKIYTVIGELVWSRSFSKNEPEGTSGKHEVVWNAKNDRGNKVLNGIYVIFLKTGHGETAMTKAAVIK
jgi:hypothetical protein